MPIQYWCYGGADSCFLCLGKRVWLRPGKKYLFGRVKQEGGRVAIAALHITMHRGYVLMDAVPQFDMSFSIIRYLDSIW